MSGDQGNDSQHAALRSQFGIGPRQVTQVAFIQSLAYRWWSVSCSRSTSLAADVGVELLDGQPDHPVDNRLWRDVELVTGASPQTVCLGYL